MHLQAFLTWYRYQSKLSIYLMLFPSYQTQFHALASLKPIHAQKTTNLFLLQLVGAWHSSITKTTQVRLIVTAVLVIQWEYVAQLRYLCCHAGAEIQHQHKQDHNWGRDNWSTLCHPKKYINCLLDSCVTINFTCDQFMSCTPVGYWNLAKYVGGSHHTCWVTGM